MYVECSGSTLKADYFRLTASQVRSRKRRRYIFDSTRLKQRIRIRMVLLAIPQSAGNMRVHL